MTNETKLLGFTPAGPGAVEERWQHVEVEVMDWDRVDDRQALKTWLDSYAHGPATTLRNVTKEAERFLLWMEHKHGENTRLLPLDPSNYYGMASDTNQGSAGTVLGTGMGLAMGRWYLRKLLFGFDDPAPEPVSAKRQKIFIIYAWFTWLYRFFLFCGIALLVYIFTFKILGIVLFLIEIGGFIALPIFRELTSWWKMKSMLKWNRHVITTFSVLVISLTGLLFPWETSISLPAIIKAQNYTRIYSLEDAQVTAVAVKIGDSVQAGQQLLSLTSDDIDHQMHKSQLNIAVWQEKLAKIAGSRENLDMNLVLHQALIREQKILTGLQQRKKQLSINSPLSGKIVDMRPIKSGQMISRNEPLISIIGDQGYEIVAFLPARDFDSIALKAHAVFIGNNGHKTPVSFRVTDISQMTIPSLPYSELGSDYNGPIAARQEKEQELIPEQAYYKVTLLPDETIQPPSLRTLGFVVIDGKPKSYLTRIWQSAAGIFIRESGF